MNVAVIGLGISGCRAAQLLADQGHKVVCFERSNRIGGRLYSPACSNGGFWEAGGEWIDAEHQRTLDLLRSLEIEIEASRQYPGRLIFDGEEASEDQPWDDASQDAERFLDAASKLSEQLSAGENLEQYLQWSVHDFIRSSARTRRGKWYISATIRSDEGDDVDKIGLLPWLRSQKLYEGRKGGEMSAFRSKDGLDSVCRKLLLNSSAKIKLNQTVDQVIQSIGSVEIRSNSNWRLFDHVVIATNMMVSASLIGSDVPASVKHALAKLTPSDIVKCAICLNQANAEPAVNQRRVLINAWVQQMWDGSRGGSNAVVSYTCGRGAKKSRSVREYKRLIATDFEKCYKMKLPDDAKLQVQNWCGIGFSHLPPGCTGLESSALQKPLRRIHFAGEHTAVWSGFIEGALESAERVVNEICEK